MLLTSFGCSSALTPCTNQQETIFAIVVVFLFFPFFLLILFYLWFSMLKYTKKKKGFKKQVAYQQNRIY